MANTTIDNHSNSNHSNPVSLYPAITMAWIDDVRQHVGRLTDDSLLARLQRLSAERRNIVAELLVVLAELDERKR